MPEEASQSEEQQASQESAQTGSGENTGREGATQEPASEATESQEPSLEQLQKDQQEAARKISEQGEQLKQYEGQLASSHATISQYQQAIGALSGQVRAQQDPVDAAWQQYLRVQQEDPYNPEGHAAALQQWQQARETKLADDIVNRVTQMTQLQQDLPKAGSMLGINDQNALSSELGAVHKSLTPSELAMVKLAREGRLAEHMTAEQKAAEERAAQAEFLTRSTQDLGGGGAVPGAQRGGRPQTQAATDDNFMMWNADTQKAWIEGGNAVVDRHGEVIENALEVLGKK